MGLVSSRPAEGFPPVHTLSSCPCVHTFSPYEDTSQTGSGPSCPNTEAHWDARMRASKDEFWGHSSVHSINQPTSLTREQQKEPEGPCPFQSLPFQNMPFLLSSQEGFYTWNKEFLTKSIILRKHLCRPVKLTSDLKEEHIDGGWAVVDRARIGRNTRGRWGSPDL